jgi:hypothetical protein
MMHGRWLDINSLTHEEPNGSPNLKTNSNKENSFIIILGSTQSKVYVNTIFFVSAFYLGNIISKVLTILWWSKSQKTP